MQSSTLPLHEARIKRALAGENAATSLVRFVLYCMNEFKLKGRVKPTEPCARGSVLR